MLNSIVNFSKVTWRGTTLRALTAALLLAFTFGVSSLRAAPGETSAVLRGARPDTASGTVLVDVALDMWGGELPDTRAWQRHEDASGCWQWPGARELDR